MGFDEPDDRLLPEVHPEADVETPGISYSEEAFYPMKTGTELISDERARQIAAEGWTAEHEDKHTRGELSAAADSYRIYANKLLEYGDKLPPCFIPKQWPWERSWWKPSKDPVRNLVKAGALYQAQADFCRRHNQMDECEIAERFCVRLIAQKIDTLLAAARP